MTGDIGEKVLRKFRNVIDKTPGYKTFCTITEVLSEETFKTVEIQEELTPNDLSLLKREASNEQSSKQNFSHCHRSRLCPNAR